MERTLEAEALRLYRRYARELVEAYSICPWAASARAGGEVRELVLTEPNGPTLDAAIDEALASLVDASQIAIALLICPRAQLPRDAWERTVSAASGRHQQRFEPEAPFVLAAFHPQARPRLDKPERLVPFLRRTPDPTIQVVRYAVLRAVKKHETGTAFMDEHALGALLARGELPAPQPRSTSEAIAAHNLETVERLGVERVAALLDDIAADRARSYAQLGIEAGSHESEEH